MAVRDIVRMGAIGLLKPAQPVTQFNTPELDALIQDMVDTMRHYHGAGIAAPQIGVSQQIFIYELADNPRYPNNTQHSSLKVVINPEYRALSTQQDEDWEGCLSVPGMRGLVSRFTHIALTAYDQYGEHYECELKGFAARVVQHEGDHLQGILYPMRISDLRHFGFEDELIKRGNV